MIIRSDAALNDTMRGVAPDASLVVLLSEIEIVGALSSSVTVIVA